MNLSLLCYWLMAANPETSKRLTEQLDRSKAPKMYRMYDLIIYNLMQLTSLTRTLQTGNSHCVCECNIQKTGLGNVQTVQ
jgi:hypothetical protein